MYLFWLSTQTADGADLYPASDRIARALPQVEEALSDNIRGESPQLLAARIGDDLARSHTIRKSDTAFGMSLR